MGTVQRCDEPVAPFWQRLDIQRTIRPVAQPVADLLDAEIDGLIEVDVCPVGPGWCNGYWLVEELEMCKRAYRWAG